jgi:hypothetical protein
MDITINSNRVVIMQDYIICYGRRGTLEVIEAPSLQAAQDKAAELSMRQGILDDELSDTTFAVPYSDVLAYEYDLGEYDDSDIFVRPTPRPWHTL